MKNKRLTKHRPKLKRRTNEDPSLGLRSATRQVTTNSLRPSKKTVARTAITTVSYEPHLTRYLVLIEDCYD
jgi:hypothetical protein